MKNKKIIMIVAVLVMFFIIGYFLLNENSTKTPVEYGKYSFPVSKDIPKAKAKVAPTYDLPSTSLPEPEQ
jgi:hypothetical protein